jgi:hypothetical protein
MSTHKRLLSWTAVVASLAALALPATAGSAPGTGRPTSTGGVSVPPLLWSGQAWVPRGIGGKGPYGTTYNTAGVFVDSVGHLHLSVSQVNGEWTGAELQSLSGDFGYGSYTFVVRTPIRQMDPNAVIGFYTRDPLSPSLSGYPAPGPGDDPRYVGHGETDVEVGPRIWKKHGPGGQAWPTPYTTQFVVQPWYVKNHTRRITIPKTIPYTVQFVWAARKTTFSIWKGATTSGRPISRWTSPSSNGTPRPDTNVLLDAWLINHQPPALGMPSEIVVDSFRYSPAR